MDVTAVDWSKTKEAKTKTVTAGQTCRLKYDSSHLWEYRFRVFGTKKEVRDWKISGEDAGYFEITDYGLLL